MNRGIGINLNELAASVADFGTILPVLFAVSLVADFHIGPALIFLAAWYAITGVYFGIPMPVEPMKAIGAIVIAGGASKGEIAASGIIIGVLFLLFGIFRVMKYLRKIIPLPVIRGIQLGLSLILLKTSLMFFKDDPVSASAGVTVILLFFILGRWRGVPDFSALIIIAGGIGLTLFYNGMPEIKGLHFGLVNFSLPDDFIISSWRLVLPQIPLTIANAILATSLLAADLFKKDITDDSLSRSIGLMNIVSAPFGGFPMCHGAGGMAAHYRFGGRTGGTNIIAAVILLIFALFFTDPAAIALIPAGIFASLLIFVALELGKHGLRSQVPALSVVIAVTALVFDMTTGFVLGLLLAAAGEKFKIPSLYS